MEKKYYKYLIFSLILITSLFFYRIYFKDVNNLNTKVIKQDNTELNKNNLIKNLKYSVKLENNTQYSITALESEITYVDNNEIVLMKNVKGFFENKNQSILKISSKKAIFNNNNYNTFFEEDVKIEYMGNIMGSDKLILNFEKNVVVMRDNIVYEGLKGLGKADIVKIDLITRDIEISMNDQNNKIEITSQ